MSSPISLIISPPSPSNENDHPLPPPESDLRSQISHPRDTHASEEGSLTTKNSSHIMQYNQGQAGGSGSNGQGQGQAQGQGGEKNGPRPLRAPAPGPLNIGYSNHQQGMPQMPQYQFQNQGQNQNQSQYGGNVGYPTNYPPGPPRRPSGGNDISPFQTTGTSLPSGSANSSPINQFSYQHPQPPYINIDRTEPMGARPLPMIPSEPRMGHYSNYQTYPQPQPQQQHQGFDQWHPGQHQGQGQGNEQISQSRRSTISNASEHNISRPTTSDALKVKDMVKIEPAMEEEEDEEKLDHRKRKRNRTIRSCVPCHNHKRKCDRKRPCGRCTALGLTGTCVYEIDENRDMSDPTVAESDRLKKRIAELEQVVRELRQKHVPRQNQPTPAITSTAGATSASAPTPLITIEEPDKGQDSKKRRVIVDRFARFKIGEAALADMAAAAHRDTPGAGPPHSSGDGEGKVDYKTETYHMNMKPGEEMIQDKVGRKTFLGAPAGASMLRRIRELTSTQAGSTSSGPMDDLLSVPEDHAFGIVFPDMRKTFPFTTIWSHENFSGEIIGLLPNKEQAEVLLQAWKEEVVTIILGYHVPTLEDEYRKFFDMSTAEKMNVPMSCLAVYLMICSCGCVMRAARNEIFGPDEVPRSGPEEFRDNKDLTSSRLQSELYLSAAYQALRLCSFLSNPTLYTVQAQLLINVYLYASERASDSWSLVGSLVRQCISLGLHVDPISLDPNVSMRDAEVRRRLWWSVAGLDCLLCSLFGRPSCITYYTTALPQDRTDDNLSDAPGSAQFQLPPSNVLRNETTDMTFHAAYFQLTIPSFELLSRVFSMKRDFSRSTVFGWFSPSPDTDRTKDDHPHTYQDALKLASDISAWYKNLPRGIRFEPEEDTPQHLLKTRDKLIINQSLMLCMKTHILLVILHRPYLRFDPAAYPESQEIVVNAATIILTAYETAFQTKASVFWVWWSIPYRTFHAGAVCAFIAIREPSSERGRKCLATLRNAIHLFEDRLAGWNTAHPVQSDLVNGLVRLEKLATAATHRTEKSSLQVPCTPSKNGESSNSAQGPGRPRSPGVAGLLSPAPLWHGTHIAGGSNGPGGGGGFHTHLVPPGLSNSPAHGHHQQGGYNTPHSMMRAFPDMAGASPNLQASEGHNNHEIPVSPMPMFNTANGDGMASIGLTPFTSGSEAATLPQFWAEMFGIKLDGDQSLAMS